MLRSIMTILFLFVLWLLMSGIAKPLIVALGAISSIFVVFIVHRMDNKADYGRLEIQLRSIPTIKYFGWLFVEIIKSNWKVMKTILSPDMGFQEHMFYVPYSQKTELGQTIFANSITLTPGTISVEVEENMFLVHALSYTGTTKFEISKMNQNVSKIESIEDD